MFKKMFLYKKFEIIKIKYNQMFVQKNNIKWVYLNSDLRIKLISRCL